MAITRSSPDFWRTLFAFIVPSLVGVFLFMTPVPIDDVVTIPIAVMAKSLQALVKPIIFPLILGIICLTGIMSVLVSVLKPASLKRYPLIQHLFNVSPVWLVTRTLGMVFIIMTYFKVGPLAIHSDSTGTLVFHELLPVLFSVFILAGLLLPLLLNFGLLELVGTLFTKVMRPLFGVPGRSAVNCVASWLGDGSVGILMTARQYEDKHYTEREAAIIGTTFSAVSITFCLVVIGQVKLEYLFAPFYLTVCLAGFVAALIVPRLPPLRFKKHLYVDGTEPDDNAEAVPPGKTLFKHALDVALLKAQNAPGVKGTLKEGIHNALDMVFAVIPVVMAVGTVALIIAEYTPVFQILGRPFVPLLEFLQVPEAAKAAETIVVGFADMFIPSILAASSIESDMTRFIVAALSVSQLIYMSEVGALLLGSKIPVNLWELFLIFILRTLVTLPVIVLMAHWLVG
ncbi:Predicted arginine uptake transporter [Pseudoalteromonas luteoviolacea B = ATCC 29581]|nr:Predicted arginine uptake transporter [Pseudoalteromonas luteoviolacea B = ATCC 29581]